MSLACLLSGSSYSIAVSAQQVNAGPSFPCAMAKTPTEKLICSDPELSSLDLEYARSYEQLLKSSGKNDADNFKSQAKFFLQYRDRCAIDKLDTEALRAASIPCVANWYYWRIAELSELPISPPVAWSPKLIGGISIYTDRHRGLPQTSAMKPAPTLYFKPRGSETLFKWIGNFEGAQPASMDWSGVYYVYENVLGSLTYVAKYSDDGQLDQAYFFNRDGRLAARQERFDTKSAGKVYVENETVFYDENGREPRRVLQANYDGKPTLPRTDLLPNRAPSPGFNTFSVLSDKLFMNAKVLDEEQLGICIIELSDGYGSSSRILNFPAEPLNTYQRALPAMNLRTFDNSDPVKGKSKGITELLGTLSGKRVYTVKYPGGLTGILVERQPDRFLPVLYVNPELKIDRLEIMKIGNEDLLIYSTTISGTGHFTLDWFFTLSHGIPVSVHYQTVLAEELKRILPKDHGIRKGGGFNPDTLVYSSGVWTDKQGNCCPAGGTVEVALGFAQGRFFVKSSHYEMPR